ncbi:MAG: M23 family metallopeptidase [Leptolyngbyaceae cyanobacterium MAG.088]|nr:M23 family metallopeptidase [Leptolyngbyaceae cyanobacterium MAG.088]
MMNTLSTPQFYGPSTIGFHHGLDLLADAGTAIYAPVSGKVAMQNYYPRANTPYTYEVSIQTETGYRWELHHIDETTIPDSVRQLAQTGEDVEAGTFLGEVFDATVVNTLPHLHLNVLDPEGYYVNPRQFLPEIDDEIAPTIRGLYLVNDQGNVVENPSSGDYELVVDVVDAIPPSTIDQSIYRLEVTSQSGEETTLWQRLFDQLPIPGDFISEATAIYRSEPITLTDGSILAHQFEPELPRRFLYRVPIELQVGTTLIQVTAADFSGNQNQSTLTFETSPCSSCGD